MMEIKMNFLENKQTNKNTKIKTKWFTLDRQVLKLCYVADHGQITVPKHLTLK